MLSLIHILQWIPGIGSEKIAAPQARLMATVISGILSRKLPWGLVLLGVCIVITVELLGIRSLAFAVGAYLSIGTTLAIFTGGVMRWLVDAAVKKAGGDPEAEGDVSPGSLYALSLIHISQVHRRGAAVHPAQFVALPAGEAGCANRLTAIPPGMPQEQSLHSFTVSQ